MKPCLCGCGELVGWKGGKMLTFVNREHYNAAMRTPAYARFINRRAIAAGRAARAVHRRRAMLAAERYPTKADAYRAGYINCHRLLAKWFRKRLAREIQRLSRPMAVAS